MGCSSIFVFYNLFFYFLIFFTCIHQLVPYDGDDWINLSLTRGAYPIWGIHNPIKVLPETLMPICGYISAYLFYPILNEYITSITFCAAIIVSVFITFYFYNFYRVIDKKFQLSTTSNLLLTLILIFMHFMIFKSHKINNTYMFFTGNLNCYFHYIIPAILNSILVLYLMIIRNFLSEINILKSGVLFLAIYFAIFSNILHSIILIALLSIELLLTFIGNKNFSIENFYKFIINNRIWFFLIDIWLISLLFEANGGRSNSIGNSILALPIKETLVVLSNLLKQVSNGFIVVFAMSILSAFIIYLKNKEKNETDYLYKSIGIRTILCCGLTLIYIILVSAKASPSYIGRVDVAFSFLIYIFILIFISLAYIFEKNLNF